MPKPELNSPEALLELLFSKIEGKVSHVILVPWLRRGGADLEAINYCKAIELITPNAKTLVVSTEVADSEWAERLPNQASFLEFGKVASKLEFKEQADLLSRFLTLLEPDVVHLINSNTGYEAIERHGKKISSIAGVFVSIFCEDYTRRGRICGYPVERLPTIIPFVSGIFADNRRVLQLVEERSVIKRELLRVHYQPLNLQKPWPNKFETSNSKELQIIWAGRLDRQKRPDLLLKIARKCDRIPVQFHVFGEPVMESVVKPQKFSKRRNIEFHGSFDGFGDVLTQSYHLFLCTSQWEGLPNTLIEASSVGLPTISSNVGGISELVESNTTGLLISPYDDISAYERAIRWSVDNRDRLGEMGARARTTVERRHSWSQFLQTLGRTEDYFAPCS